MGSGETIPQKDEGQENGPEIITTGTASEHSMLGAWIGVGVLAVILIIAVVRRVFKKHED